jgi:hypothetical protein
MCIGLECGATFVDREFLTFLSRIIELADADFDGVGNGGHTIASGKQMRLLDIFEPIKCRFGDPSQGDQSYDVTGQSIRNTPYAQDKVKGGSLLISRYVYPSLPL